MKYVCLVYGAAEPFASMSVAELDALDDASLANDEELRRRGHLIAASALEPVDAAVTVRVRNGRLSTTDGPFAETHEQLGGFLFIEAVDLNEAIRIASQVPVARFTSIEVRPARDLRVTVRERGAARTDAAREAALDLASKWPSPEPADSTPAGR